MYGISITEAYINFSIKKISNCKKKKESVIWAGCSRNVSSLSHEASDKGSQLGADLPTVLLTHTVGRFF